MVFYDDFLHFLKIQKIFVELHQNYHVALTFLPITHATYCFLKKKNHVILLFFPFYFTILFIEYYQVYVPYTRKFVSFKALGSPTHNILNALTNKHFLNLYSNKGQNDK